MPLGIRGKHIVKIEINNEFKITVDSNVTLLNVEIDENLKFDTHIDNICKTAAKQLNSLKRIEGSNRHTGKAYGGKEKKINNGL